MSFVNNCGHFGHEETVNSIKLSLKDMEAKTGSGENGERSLLR